MLRFGIVGFVILSVVVFGFSLIDDVGGGEVNASALLTAPVPDISGYARAYEPRDWQFPADHGAHPDFQTEWWYYTGNVSTEDGRRFGYQFTIFRRAVTPQPNYTASEWRSNQIYMAHFTVSDIETEGFYHEQRISREGAGLAGATVDPRYRVWVENWTIAGENDDATLQSIRAVTDDVAIDVTLEQVKEPALQGNRGLSAKSDEPGNASYYYSLSRLITEGTITINGETFTVSGTTWMDHEFSTSALGDDALGWDWFGLYFDNNTELMIGQIRKVDGSKDPSFGGLLVNPDGSTRYLSADDFTITPTASWTSPHTGAIYPAGWDVEIKGTDGLRFSISPLMPDQELHGGGIQYWEGAVQITGDVNGFGYAELTGYATSMQGRF